MKVTGIQEARSRRGLTQKQLAEQLGVSVVTVGKWECGLRLPSLEKLVAIADLLEVTTDELLGRVVPSAASPPPSPAPTRAVNDIRF